MPQRSTECYLLPGAAVAVLLWAASGFAEVLKCDFGTTNSPVLAGFTRVTETSPMLSSPNALVSFWRKTPDDLAGDGVVAPRGGFRFETSISNGTYCVWVLSGDSANGSYAAIKHLLQKVRIRANGRRVFTQQRDYWYAEKFDYDPHADVWERYAGTNRFIEASFVVNVNNQRLRLDFDGLSGPRYDFAFPLNAIMVFPEADANQMMRACANVRAERRRQWSSHFPQVPLPEPDRPWTPDPLSASRGYAAWWQDYLDKVYPNTVPRAAGAGGDPGPIAALGEWEPVTFCIRPLTNLSRVAVTASDLRSSEGHINRQHVFPYLVRYAEKVERSGQWHAAEPWCLIPWNNPDIPSEVTRQCWLKVKVPTNALPGVYRGTVTLAPENAAATNLAYQLRVLPFALDRTTNASFFYFGSRSGIEFDTGGRGWFDNPAWWRFYKIEASNLVAHGFTPVPEIKVAGGGAYGVDATPIIGDRTNLVRMDWAKARKRIGWLAKRGFSPPDRMWMVHAEGYGLTYCRGKLQPSPWWNPDPAYSNLFCHITREIDRQFRHAGWGVPVFEWCGELSNHGTAVLESAVHAYSALKSCGVLTALRGNGWVDWSLYATNRLVDFPTPNIALLRDRYTDWIANNCQALWLYNFLGGRYGFGFFAWAKGATRRLHEGHLNSSGAPWDKFDGDHYQWQRGVEPTRDGVAPLVGFEWMAEGRDDYDYVTTLERRIVRAPAGAAKEAGRQALDRIRSACVTDVVYRGGAGEPGSPEEAVSLRDLQTWRAAVAEAIVRLQE